MSSPTNDPDSPSEPAHAEPPDRVQVLSALARLTGVIQQTPPNFSALKIQGKRASDRTRDGETVRLTARPVHIYDIELLEYVWPMLRVRIHCGKGTYVRAIARDLGIALKTGGMLTELRRTRIGAIHVDQALPLSQLTRELIEQQLIRPDRLVPQAAPPFRPPPIGQDRTSMQGS